MIYIVTEDRVTIRAILPGVEYMLMPELVHLLIRRGNDTILALAGHRSLQPRALAQPVDLLAQRAAEHRRNRVGIGVEAVQDLPNLVVENFYQKTKNSIESGS